MASRAGVKNVQIEAPGTMFIPGYLYTIRIEHSGGLRIDINPLPEILKGEKIFSWNRNIKLCAAMIYGCNGMSAPTIFPAALKTGLL